MKSPARITFRGIALQHSFQHATFNLLPRLTHVVNSRIKILHNSTFESNFFLQIFPFSYGGIIPHFLLVNVHCIYILMYES